MQDSIHNVLGDLHAMCREIQHTILVSEVGLASALQKQADDIAEESSIQIDLQVPPTHEIKLIPRDTQDFLYRISQELLRNVRKHSHAQRVQITLSVPSKQVYFEVRDDGSGFELPESFGRFVENNHFGLAGLRQQVTALGGKVNIESVIDQGTSVQVFLPLDFPNKVVDAN